MPRSRTFDEGLRLIRDDATTLDMLQLWVKYKEIDLFVEHQIDIAELEKETFILSGPPVVRDTNEGGPTDECLNKAFDTDESSQGVGGIFNDHVIDVDNEDLGFDKFGADEGDLGVESDEGEFLESEDDENIYLVKVRYLSKDEGDEELGS